MIFNLKVIEAVNYLSAEDRAVKIFSLKLYFVR